jgi:hypothetical protein
LSSASIEWILSQPKTFAFFIFGPQKSCPLKNNNGALVALRVAVCLGGDKGCRPFPRTLFAACGILPPLRSAQVSLDEAEHFLHN